ncbi:MAG: hypothetical protein GKR91_10175 [Pseudomonadales bacterium]|nr:hypothetical protein [Pseudomonadales bacterium]
MTNNFISAAELMARVLGSLNYQFAVIDHPVSSATDDELAAKAEQTLQAIDELILQK